MTGAEEVRPMSVELTVAARGLEEASFQPAAVHRAAIWFEALEPCSPALMLVSIEVANEEQLAYEEGIPAAVFGEIDSVQLVVLPVVEPSQRVVVRFANPGATPCHFRIWFGRIRELTLKASAAQLLRAAATPAEP